MRSGAWVCSSWERETQEQKGQGQRALMDCTPRMEATRQISVPEFKRRRAHEYHENNAAVSPEVQVLFHLRHDLFDGVLCMHKAKASRHYRDGDWCRSLRLDVESPERKGYDFEDIYKRACELMDEGALPEVSRDPNPDSQRSLAAHRCRQVADELNEGLGEGKMSDGSFKHVCRRLSHQHGTGISFAPKA